MARATLRLNKSTVDDFIFDDDVELSQKQLRRTDVDGGRHRPLFIATTKNHQWFYFLFKKKESATSEISGGCCWCFTRVLFLFRWRVGRNEEWRWCEVFLSFWNKSNKRTNIRIIVGGMNDRSSGRPYRRIFFHFLGFFFFKLEGESKWISFYFLKLSTFIAVSLTELEGMGKK